MMKGELVGIMNVEGKEQRSKNELAKFRKIRQQKPNKLCGEKYALKQHIFHGMQFLKTFYLIEPGRIKCFLTNII